MATVMAASAHAQVTLMRADITGRSEAAAAVDAARCGSGACLGGIMHAAGLQVLGVMMPVHNASREIT